MKKLDKEILPSDYSTDRTEDGFVAEFHDDGQLLHYGYYQEGEIDDRWSLYVEEDASGAYAERLMTVKFNRSDDEFNHNGHGEKPRTPEEEEEFAEFVQYWVDRIHEDAAAPLPRCAFCDKSAGEVQRLIEGNKTCICNECVQFCYEILIEDQSEET
jgi:hypothetical protein